MKNHIPCALILILCIQLLDAQYLPFQGKLFDQNDQPLNGTYNFSFSIQDGGVNWTETHPNVSVFQGIYAVVLGSLNLLPDGLFKNNAMHTVNIQLNGENLDDVLIYRPIENDPKVPDELKDGVHWEDIQNPPAIGGSGGAPIGSIIAYGGVNIPEGWLKCDGTAVSRTEFSELFAALSISWGAGDGVNTFHLPDLRGRFLRGTDEGAGNDPDAAERTALHLLGNAGDQLGSYQPDQVLSHFHRLSIGDARTNVSSNGANTISSPRGYNTTEQDYDFGTGYYTNRIGGNETRPKNASVYFIIKAR